ncbi:unnamed protein product, partial [marine sediment metagenome]
GRFTQKQLIDGMLSEFIDWEEGKDQLREMGWGEEDLATLLNLELDSVSTAEMRKIIQYDLLTPKDVALWFRRRGHPPIESDWLAKFLEDEESQRIRLRIAKLALDAWDGAAETWSTVEAYLGAAHYTTQEQHLLFVEAQIRLIPKPEKAPTERSLTASQVGARYKSGILTRPEAETYLTALPYQADQIADFLDYYIPDVPKEEGPREVGAGVVGGLFKRGEITEAEFRIDLVMLDYEGWAVERLVTYYKPVEPKPP